MNVSTVMGVVSVASVVSVVGSTVVVTRIGKIVTLLIMFFLKIFQSTLKKYCCCYFL